ncbi:MAG: universal stress protein, partial [Phycisphaerae bacterium]
MAKSPVNHILIVADGTEESFNAADRAIDLARALGARLTALAVVDTETLRQLLSARILVDAEMGEFEKELEESAR